MNLPSQKLFFVALPVILAVGLFVLFHNPSSPDTAGENGGLKAVAVANSNTISEIDSDSDGVPDWEEALWHTDPQKPVTFNSTPDADYIAGQVKAQANPSLSSGPITSTDELSQQLFAEYISLKKSGGLSADTISAMTARLAGNIAASSTPVTYTLADLKTFPDTDTDKMQIYADTLAQTESQYSGQYKSQTENDSTTFGDPAFERDMNIAADYYTKLAQTIMRLEVPNGIASQHIAYANSLMLSAVSLRAFADSTDEPLAGMLGVKNHTEAQARQQSAIATITSFLYQNGMIGFSLPIF